MKKIMIGVLTIISLSAFSAELEHVKTAKFKQDPIAYLEKFAQKNPPPAGDAYIAINVSPNVWISSMSLSADRDFIELLSYEGGDFSIYQLHHFESVKTLISSSVIGYHGPFDGGAELITDTYYVSASGVVTKFQSTDKQTYKSGTVTEIMKYQLKENPVINQATTK